MPLRSAWNCFCAGFALLLALVMLASPAPLHATPAFSADMPESTDAGYVLASWEGSETVTLEIAPWPHRSGQPGPFRPLYTGKNTAYFLSGLADGDYALRLRDATGAQSAPFRLTVAHQSTTRALLLALLGAIVFLGVVAVIAKGAAHDDA
ncbi:MAG: hypothetical protein R3E21_02000 [Caenibius sp.]